MLNFIMLFQGLYTAWKCSVGGLWRLWLANGSDCPWRKTLIGQKTLPIVQYEWLSTGKASDWSKDVVHCVVCSGCYRNVFKQWNTKKCLFPPKIPALQKSNPRQDAPRPWKHTKSKTPYPLLPIPRSANLNEGNPVMAPRVLLYRF